jgi:hypothetical protein
VRDDIIAIDENPVGNASGLQRAVFRKKEGMAWPATVSPRHNLEALERTYMPSGDLTGKRSCFINLKQQGSKQQPLQNQRSGRFQL